MTIVLISATAYLVVFCSDQILYKVPASVPNFRCDLHLQLRWWRIWGIAKSSRRWHLRRNRSSCVWSKTCQKLNKNFWQLTLPSPSPATAARCRSHWKFKIRAGPSVCIELAVVSQLSKQQNKKIQPSSSLTGQIWQILISMISMTRECPVLHIHWESSVYHCINKGVFTKPILKRLLSNNFVFNLFCFALLSKSCGNFNLHVFCNYIRWILHLF